MSDWAFPAALCSFSQNIFVFLDPSTVPPWRDPLRPIPGLALCCWQEKPGPLCTTPGGTILPGVNVNDSPVPTSVKVHPGGSPKKDLPTNATFVSSSKLPHKSALQVEPQTHCVNFQPY